MSVQMKNGGIPPKISGNFYGKDFIEISQLNKEDVYKIFEQAEEIREAYDSGSISDLKVNARAAILFFQNSTRTYSSFNRACQILGLDVFAEHGMSAFSLAMKGEFLRRTIQSIYQTQMLTAGDVIIMRHPDTNSSHIAASAVDASIVNAGSGSLRHPTQALLDLYTIWKDIKNLNNIELIFMGDLKFGRTVKSLGSLISMVGKNIKINLVSPDICSLPDKLREEWEEAGVKTTQTTDVLYVTRLQQEWFEKSNMMNEYNKIKADYIIDYELIKKAKNNTLLMHPLPSNGEMEDPKLDEYAGARYLNQMKNGTLVRSALIRQITKK
ncbi:MAG: hypothetical protein Q9M91_05275 [Candidatus Dojkabacteria bacterium]|nr:hypothetical protein [Candidatus Dojkabacteria bacterium]MDQ7021216.1 hypothetical protein [Candidatus Dojkabacteria bacterium]